MISRAFGLSVYFSCNLKITACAGRKCFMLFIDSSHTATTMEMVESELCDRSRIQSCVLVFALNWIWFVWYTTRSTIAARCQVRMAVMWSAGAPCASSAPIGSRKCVSLFLDGSLVSFFPLIGFSTVRTHCILIGLRHHDDYHSGLMPSADGCYVKGWITMCTISTHWN